MTVYDYLDKRKNLEVFSPDELIDMVNSPSNMLREIAALDENIPMHLLEILIDDEFIEVVISVMWHKYLSVTILEKAINHSDIRIAHDALRKPNMTDELRMLAKLKGIF